MTGYLIVIGVMLSVCIRLYRDWSNARALAGAYRHLSQAQQLLIVELKRRIRFYEPDFELHSYPDGTDSDAE